MRLLASGAAVFMAALAATQQPGIVAHPEGPPQSYDTDESPAFDPETAYLNQPRSRTRGSDILAA